jgi:hypothetical protein
MPDERNLPESMNILVRRQAETMSYLRPDADLQRLLYKLEAILP